MIDFTYPKDIAKKFQLEQFVIDGKLLPLSKPIVEDDNVYTMLVGKNASGKTRALSKISNNYIFQKSDTQIDAFETFNSAEKPRQVITVSNSKFDRFPDPDEIGKRNEELAVDYHYLGLGSFRSSAYSILSRACAGNFENFRKRKFHAEMIAFIFDYIGFLPAVHIELRRPHFRSSNQSLDPLRDEFWRSQSNKEYQTNDHFYESKILPALEYLSYRFEKQRSITFNLDLQHGLQGDNNFMEFAEYATVLIQIGMLKVGKFIVFDKKTKDKVPIHLASSGQQCMMLMFFGLAGVIKDGSLICIDEPEISLHPKWQSEFINLLQGAFSRHRGCHFLIATHSPQIVSGLASENGFVVDLEINKLLFPQEYAKKSADYQLTKIFHEPGYKNEYLIRTLLVILSKITNKQSITIEDREKLQQIVELKDRLEDSDPVVHLLSQVQVLTDEKN
jgi:hypothetical protein